MGVRRLRKGRVQGICSTHNVYLYEHCNKIICEMLLNKERTLPSRLSSPLSTTHEVLEGRTYLVICATAGLAHTPVFAGLLLNVRL